MSLTEPLNAPALPSATSVGADHPVGLFGDDRRTEVRRIGADALVAAGKLLLPILERGTVLDARTLRLTMEEAFGASDADGAWVWKDAYEAAETATVLFLTKYGPTLRKECRAPDGRLKASAMVTTMERLAALLPSHTRRSEESVALQQFSTPLPLGAVAAQAADIRRGEVVLEPSAGTGLLAVHAHMAGARLALNELAETRAAICGSLYDNLVTCHDAATIHDRLDAGIVPSVVLMNPPFSAGASIEGRYREATLAHVRSALSRLAPGGRLVAITGASFSPDRPVWREAFVRLQETATLRFTASVSGKAYARHGTTTETRFTVLDKVPAADPRIVPEPLKQAENASDLLELLEAHLPSRIDAAAGSRTLQLQGAGHVAHERAKVSSPSRFFTPCGPKTRTRIDPAAFALQPSEHKLDRVETGPVAYDLRTDDAASDGTPATDAADALYEPYTVQTIVIAGAKPHPSRLVQSGAMASVAPPVPSHVPTLPVSLIRSGLLSDAQLESVIYAGDAHAGHVGGHYRVEPTLDRVDRCEADAQGAVQFRRGWFLGDGTGAGKGRQVAGILMDNWLQGRRRAVWVSKSDKLIEDAVRDWTALGGAKSDIVPLSGFRQGAPIGLYEGILFTTYATLRTQSKGDKASRVEQIAEWLQLMAVEGEPRALFDGCLIFDEAHAMANAAASKGSRGERHASQQGLAGLRLQNALPDARVVYVSATGATQVSNLAYASRLGLWGTGDFPFETRETFVAAMEAGGVAAMEVISRDLKSLGLYASRSLSYDGVEYDTLVHELADGQRAIYDAYADAYQVIHQNLEQALKASGITSETQGCLNAQAKSAARSAFESSKQRFFNHLLTAMKCPSLITAIERELAAGHACVVQVVSTGEALMERRLAEIPANQWSDLDVDITPREYVLDYLKSSFPIQLFEAYTDDDGNLRSRPARDADGHPIVCREAEARRDAMIEHLGALPAVNGAMDQLIWHFGTENVAEVTGRSRRVVRHKDGRLAIEPRPASSNYGETNAFMDDDKRILIFSDAGGTGRSYHADLGAKNQRKRVHYLLEPGWKADNAIQGLGRTNRTNQRQEPLFVLVTTDVKGEKRFVSTIARRLDTLGGAVCGRGRSATLSAFCGA